MCRTRPYELLMEDHIDCQRKTNNNHVTTWQGTTVEDTIHIDNNTYRNQT